MAERRMFAKTIVDSDTFLDMPQSTQNLYFHLAMRADDDGFINNPKKIMRMIACSNDDLKMLFIKNFIIGFEGGVVVIKHWKIHNYIRSDRYKPTIYQDEFKMLNVSENSTYTLQENGGIPLGIPNDTQMDTQVRLGKDRLGKKDILYGEAEPFILKDVVSYLNQKTGSNYKTSSKKTRTLINARVNEGFNLDDFKQVIDVKAREWSETDMEKYLRPETLFGTKFESYLNQKETKPPVPPDPQKSKYDYDKIEKRLREKMWETSLPNNPDT